MREPWEWLGEIAERVAREKHDENFYQHSGICHVSHGDFEDAFRPILEFISLEIRSAENALCQSTEAANEARGLFLYARGVQLKNDIEAKKKEIDKLRYGR